MKHLHMLAALALILCSTAAFSQSRDLGARRLILDDGAGNLLTISYEGAGAGALSIPLGGGSLTPVGTTTDATLRWSGAAWVENTNLLITAAGAISGATTVDASTAYRIGGAHALSQFGTTTRVGSGAGNSMTLAATFNTVVGADAGLNINSGMANTILGQNAGRYFTSQLNNTYLGRDAGHQNYGEGNTAVGAYAGYNISGLVTTGGDNNTFVGASSGFATTTGTTNVFVGANAGLVNSTGSNNTYLGNAATGVAAGTNQTAIGNGATATASNQVVLGNGSVTQVSTSGTIVAPAATLQSLNVASGADRFAASVLTNDASADGNEVISNTLLTASSIVVATLNTNLGGTYVANVVPGASTMTVTFSANVPDNSVLSYIIVNP
jgi:hypothetical protein